MRAGTGFYSHHLEQALKNIFVDGPTWSLPSIVTQNIATAETKANMRKTNKKGLGWGVRKVSQGGALSVLSLRGAFYSWMRMTAVASPKAMRTFILHSHTKKIFHIRFYSFWKRRSGDWEKFSNLPRSHRGVPFRRTGHGSLPPGFFPERVRVGILKRGGRGLHDLTHREGAWHSLLPPCTVAEAKEATANETDSSGARGVPTGSGRDRDDETWAQTRWSYPVISAMKKIQWADEMESGVIVFWGSQNKPL